MTSYQGNTPSITVLLSSIPNFLIVRRCAGCLAVPLALLLGLSTTSAQTNGSWNTTDGLWDTASNWTGGTIADGAGGAATFAIDADAAANFAATTFVDNGIGLSSNRTIGSMTFSDTDLSTPGSYDVYPNTADDEGTPDIDERETLTLAGNGSVPEVTVNELPAYDSSTISGSLTGIIEGVRISAQTAGTEGFVKSGVGSLTFAAPSAITGPISLKGGTLAYGIGSSHDSANAPITMADGTRLHYQLPSNAGFGNISAETGANVTLEVDNFAYINGVTGQGTGETLNVEFNDDTIYTFDGDWNGWSEVNITGNSNDGISEVRLRTNGGGFPSAAFGTAVVNVTNTRLWGRTNSYGNTFEFGELNGDATAVMGGGNAGSAARWLVGGLNTDSNFAGNWDGVGGASLIKIGTGNLTLSGQNTGVWTIPNSAGRTGGVVQVESGQLTLTGTMDSIAGGSGLEFSTINVFPGAVFDVSGTTNTFSTAPNQQVLNTGVIRGDYNHDEGFILAGDTTEASADTREGPTNVAVPTAGTITFDQGELSFNGGTIVYDMGSTPGADDLITVTNGSVNHGTGGMIDPNFLAGDPAPGLTYTFLTNTSGTFTGNVANWTVNWPGRGAKPTVFQDGNDLKFTTTAVGGSADLVWTGSVDSAWDIEGTQNWTNGGSPDVFFQGDNVRFDDTASNVTVTLSEEVSPGDMVVDSDTNNYTIGGNVISGDTLIKRGTSTLTLTAANNFGSAAIENGTVDIQGNAGALGGGVLTMGSSGAGATLLTTTNGLASSGLVLNGGDNVIQSDNGTSFGVPALSGSGNLMFATADDELRLDFGGVDPAFSGNLTIGTDTSGVANGMWVRINGAGNDFPNANITLVDNAELVNRAGASTVNPVELGSLTGSVGTLLTALGGGSTAPGTNWTIGGTGVSTTFDGIVQDGGNGPNETTAVSYLTKVGDGTLTLTAANTYTGDTSVEAGTLSINNAYLADAADVYMTTGALFDLAFAGTDVIDSLFLNGISQAVGVYGSSSTMPAGADFYVDYLSGTGLLEVSTFELTVLPGDFNNDGTVDIADYTVWRNNLGNDESVLSPGTGDESGTVDAGDYTVWKNNFGESLAAAIGSSSAANTQVPEPSALAIAGLLSVMFVMRRRIG